MRVKRESHGGEVIAKIVIAYCVLENSCGGGMRRHEAEFHTVVMPCGGERFTFIGGAERSEIQPECILRQTEGQWTYAPRSVGSQVALGLASWRYSPTEGASHSFTLRQRRQGMRIEGASSLSARTRIVGWHHDLLELRRG